VQRNFTKYGVSFVCSYSRKKYICPGHHLYKLKRMMAVSFSTLIQ